MYRDPKWRICIRTTRGRLNMRMLLMNKIYIDVKLGTCPNLRYQISVLFFKMYDAYNLKAGEIFCKASEFSGRITNETQLY